MNRSRHAALLVAFASGVTLACVDRLADDDDDPEVEELTWVWLLALAGVIGLRWRQLLGSTPGQRTRKLVHPVWEVPSPGEAVADVGGVNRSGWRPACWPESA